jgi:hypothetical protein
MDDVLGQKRYGSVGTTPSTRESHPASCSRRRRPTTPTRPASRFDESEPGNDGALPRAPGARRAARRRARLAGRSPALSSTSAVFGRPTGRDRRRVVPGPTPVRQRSAAVQFLEQLLGLAGCDHVLRRCLVGLQLLRRPVREAGPPSGSRLSRRRAARAKWCGRRYGCVLQACLAAFCDCLEFCFAVFCDCLNAVRALCCCCLKVCLAAFCCALKARLCAFVGAGC